MKTTSVPGILDNMALRHPTVDPATEDESKMKTITAGQIDKSGQRPERAVDVVIACPLGAQLGINNHCSLLLQIGQLLRYQAVKLHPPFGSKGNEDHAIVLEEVVEGC